MSSAQESAECLAARLEPLFERILIRRDAPPTHSRGGIVLPDKARAKTRHKPQRGVVVAVGPGRRRDDGGFDPLPVQPGDRVVFVHYAGTHQELDVASELIFVQERDLLARLEDI